MDALSEVLRVIKLDSAIYLNGEFSEPWCLASSESRALAPMLTQRSGQVIIYHLLCEGRAVMELHDGTQIALTAGDLITLPHGHGHLIGSGAAVAPISAIEALPAVLERGLELLRMGEEARAPDSSAAIWSAIHISADRFWAGCRLTSASGFARTSLDSGWRTRSSSASCRHRTARREQAQC